jgi:hypothetical protein
LMQLPFYLEPREEFFLFLSPSCVSSSVLLVCRFYRETSTISFNLNEYKKKTYQDLGRLVGCHKGVLVKSAWAIQLQFRRASDQF